MLPSGKLTSAMLLVAFRNQVAIAFGLLAERHAAMN
jgi:hypothetical protein